MPTRKKAKIVKKCTQDRLSSLPDPILHHILSLQDDTKFAVQTCVLSRRWKDLWKSLPILKFDSLCFSRMFCFKKFVTSVLSRHDPSIALDNFTLTRRGGNDKVFLTKVINYLVKHDVKELTLQVEWGDFVLPEKLLACRSVTALRMEGFRPENLPGKWFGFEGLNVLHLNKCSFNHQVTVFDPFSSCPNLRSLSLSECYFGEVKVFKISGPRLVELCLSAIVLISAVNCEFEVLAPGLKSFSFTDSLPMCFTMVELPCLRDVNLHVYLPYQFFRFRDVREYAALELTNLFQVLHHAQSFSLSYSTIEILIEDPNELEYQVSPLRELKKLKLNMRHGESSLMIPGGVTKYLLSACLYTASVEIENRSDELEPWRVFHPSSLRRMRF